MRKGPIDSGCRSFFGADCVNGALAIASLSMNREPVAALFSQYETAFYTNTELCSKFSSFRRVSRQTAGNRARRRLHLLLRQSKQGVLWMSGAMEVSPSPGRPGAVECICHSWRSGHSGAGIWEAEVSLSGKRVKNEYSSVMGLLGFEIMLQRR
jgi:hypothetical protein